MKLALYATADSEPRPGLIVGDAIVDVESAVSHLRGGSAQELVVRIIDGFDALRPALDGLLASGERVPLPRPSNYWEHAQREARPLNMFLKSFATSIMTLNSGDVISCGTNHEGLGPMAVHVSDPLKRTWERGIYTRASRSSWRADEIALRVASATIST